MKNATLTANHSEALVIEGKNSIVLENCAVTGSMSDPQGASSDENVHAVMIYQSMSGDADVGTSTFSMTGGSLTGKNGDLFYVTNTHCVLTLSGVTPPSPIRPPTLASSGPSATAPAAAGAPPEPTGLRWSLPPTPRPWRATSWWIPSPPWT